MPVIFNIPIRFSTRDTNYVLTSLKDTCELPEEAAIALVYYTYESDQGSAGSWSIHHWWDEDVVDVNGDPVGIQGTALLPSQKVMHAVNLGPEGSNPEKYVWTGLNFGSTYFSCIGYFTYDEVVIFPEITQGKAAYEVSAKPSESGWGSGDVAGELLQNIWDHPNMKLQEGRQPTGLIIDATRHRMVVAPYSADPTDLGYALTEGLCVSGFDANGDVWVDNYGSIASVLMGYFTVPIHWHHLEQTILSKVDGVRAGVVYHKKYPDNAAYALYEVRNSTNISWAIYMEGQSGIHDGTHFYQLQPGTYFNVLASVHPDTQEVLAYSNTGVEAQDTAYRMKGYIKKYHAEKGTTIPEVEDLDMTAPELYYPPDNVGSLHMDYPIAEGTYSYPNISDMRMYLSGGAANADPALSLGGVKSSEVLQSGLHSLFQEPTSVEVYVGLNTYRCLYLHNISGVYDSVDVRLWVEKDNEDISKMYIGSDVLGIDTEVGALVSEIARPDVDDFTLAVSRESCYNLPKIPQGSYIALWFRRSYTAQGVNGADPENATLYLSVSNSKAE